ncbi:GTP cyclohydrolase 1 feedback regulatory protein isoform X2 [Mycteria americana]|uniref:GTP cyclohydrolase 1 feedback regulatory protein isoform X2 n=1 Tax=Mycteria americana TaxID=33587 RepID=UPI003F580497
MSCPTQLKPTPPVSCCFRGSVTVPCRPMGAHLPQSLHGTFSHPSSHPSEFVEPFPGLSSTRTGNRSLTGLGMLMSRRSAPPWWETSIRIPA